jgi:predicted metal-dependent peptidase
VYARATEDDEELDIEVKPNEEKMQMGKLTAEQRIERCHVQMMKHKNFCLFSGLFMIGKVSVVDKDLPFTAQTNGLDVVYGRGFVDSLNDKQLAFLILHENMHKAYRHLIVWEKLYKQNGVLANMACDYVINLQIHDYDTQQEVTEFPTTPDGKNLGCLDEEVSWHGCTPSLS